MKMGYCDNTTMIKDKIIILDEIKLNHYYTVEKYTLYQLSILFNVCNATVTSNLKRCGIQKKQIYNQGKVEFEIIQRNNTEKYKLVWLHGKNGSYSGNYIIVDSEDYDMVQKYEWFPYKPYNVIYATFRKGCNEKFYLHRVLMKPNDNEVVDHINHNGLDNRRENLRICTQNKNVKNARKRKDSITRYKGTHKAGLNRWIAMIQNDKKHIHIGVYINEIAAARAYDKTAIELHKEFANLNFPKFDYSNYDINTDRKLFSSRYCYIIYRKRSRKWTVEKTRKVYGSFNSEQEAFNHAVKIGFLDREGNKLV